MNQKKTKPAAQDRTEVVCVIDRSGSMESIRSDAIGGFNAFLKEQQAIPGECRLTLVLFNDQVMAVCRGEDINRVRPLDHETYRPGGSTALLDAVSAAIADTRERVREATKPPIGFNAGAPAVKVIMAILTDGEENSSRHATREEVFKLITECRERLGWEFLFLAANQDAISAGGRLGIDAADAVNFAADAEGVQASMCCMSERVSSTRTAPRPRKGRKSR